MLFRLIWWQSQRMTLAINYNFKAWPAYCKCSHHWSVSLGKSLHRCEGRNSWGGCRSSASRHQRSLSPSRTVEMKWRSKLIILTSPAFHQRSASHWGWTPSSHWAPSCCQDWSPSCCRGWAPSCCRGWSPSGREHRWGSRQRARSRREKTESPPAKEQISFESWWSDLTQVLTHWSNLEQRYWLAGWWLLENHNFLCTVAFQVFANGAVWISSPCKLITGLSECSQLHGFDKSVVFCNSGSQLTQIHARINRSIGRDIYYGCRCFHLRNQSMYLLASEYYPVFKINRQCWW